MTVVVKEKHSGQVYCFLKGADEVVAERLECSEVQDLGLKACFDLNAFNKMLTMEASKGYRTLVYAIKKMSEDEIRED